MGPRGPALHKEASKINVGLAGCGGGGSAEWVRRAGTGGRGSAAAARMRRVSAVVGARETGSVHGSVAEVRRQVTVAVAMGAAARS